MSLQLSVIMPVRNAEKFVRLAVLSTLLSLPRSSELIVVNDGSTDETLARISSISDCRLRVIESPGRGIVSALNAGIESSHGTLIARMDADDICLPWRFHFQILNMKFRPDIDFLFSTAIAFGRPLLPIGLVPQLPWSLSPTKFSYLMTRRNPAVHPTMIARAAILKSLGGYAECPAEDEELWLRALLAKYSLARAWVPVLALRLHASQTTRQGEWRDSLKMDNRVASLRKKLIESRPNSQPHEGPMFRALDTLDAQGFATFSTIRLKIQSWILRLRTRRNL